MANQKLSFTTTEEVEQNYIVVDGIRFNLPALEDLTVAQQVRLNNVNKTAGPLFERFQDGEIDDEEADQVSDSLKRLVRAILLPDDASLTRKEVDEVLGRLKDAQRVQIINAFTTTSQEDEETPSSPSTGKTRSRTSTVSMEKPMEDGVVG